MDIFDGFQCRQCLLIKDCVLPFLESRKAVEEGFLRVVRELVLPESLIDQSANRQKDGEGKGEGSHGVGAGGSIPLASRFGSVRFAFHFLVMKTYRDISMINSPFSNNDLIEYISFINIPLKKSFDVLPQVSHIIEGCGPNLSCKSIKSTSFVMITVPVVLAA